MSLTIMRRIKFCAGHRLHRHGGKCEFFHGHNYVADIYVSGEQVDSVGRVIDFSVLKQVFKGWIEENWDHGFLLSENDQNGINAIKQVEPSKYFVMPYNPTAENMARYLLDHVGPQLCSDIEGYDIRVEKVIIWETDDSFAEAKIESRDDLLLLDAQDKAMSAE